MSEEPCKPTEPAGFLEDDNGNGSSTRLITVLWFLFLGSILCIVAWRSNPPVVPDVPWGIVTITFGVIGGKLWSRFLEMGGTIQGLMTGKAKN